MLKLCWAREKCIPTKQHGWACTSTGRTLSPHQYSARYFSSIHFSSWVDWYPQRKAGKVRAHTHIRISLTDWCSSYTCDLPFCSTSLVICNEILRQLYVCSPIPDVVAVNSYTNPFSDNGQVLCWMIQLRVWLAMSLFLPHMKWLHNKLNNNNNHGPISFTAFTHVIVDEVNGDNVGSSSLARRLHVPNNKYPCRISLPLQFLRFH